MVTREAKKYRGDKIIHHLPFKANKILIVKGDLLPDPEPLHSYNIKMYPHELDELFRVIKEVRNVETREDLLAIVEDFLKDRGIIPL